MTPRHFAISAALLIGLAQLAPAHGTAPVIVTDPAPQVGVLDGEARFTVVASGTLPLTYRWRKDGIDLVDGPTVSGASTPELLLSGIVAGDAADYDVVVTSGPDSTTSLAAALTTREPHGGDIDFSFRRKVVAVEAMALRPDGSAIIAGDFSFSSPSASGPRIGLVSPDGRHFAFETSGGGASERIYAMAMQPDGRLLIAGGFTTFNQTAAGRFARVNPDGTRHAFPSTGSGANGDVWALALQPDGKALIGGDFTSVHGTPRSRIARLNADGTLDPTFLSGLSGADGSVRSIAVQPDDKILVGGMFTSVNGAGRNRVARLNADGTLDAFMDGMPGANDAVHTLGLQPDGKIVLGGEFTSVNGAGRGRIARLDADGTLDSFQEGMGGTDGTVLCLAQQPDGKWLLGGVFGTVNGEPHRHVVRLLTHGAIDASHAAEADDTVASIALDGSGGAWIAGAFERVNGVIRPSIARLDDNGGLREGFASVWPVGIGFAAAFAVQDDARVLIGGPARDLPRGPSGRLFRDLPDGTVDRSYSSPTYSVGRIALQPDGKVLSIHLGLTNQTNNAVRRTDAFGMPDPGFTAPAVSRLNGAALFSLALQPDGRILMGGMFTHVGGVDRTGIARLHSDGSLDTSFQNPLLPGVPQVRAIAVQPDTKVLIGGAVAKGVARLHADGSADTGFLSGMTGADNNVEAMLLQPDGKILIGGSFTTFNGLARSRIARLNPDGSLDTTFQDGMAGADASVHAIALQTDGSVLIGGGFTSVNGVSRSQIARLHPDGSLDTSFECDVPAGVAALALQLDGRILVAGDFTTVNGTPYPMVARLLAGPLAAPTVATDPQDQISYDGCCAVFHVGASGAPRDYRWRKDGVDLTDGGNLTGAATATLRLSALSTADEGVYSVVVSNLLGSDTSAGATLDVLALPACQVAACDAVAGCLLEPVPGPGEVQGLQLQRSGTSALIGWTPAAGSTSSAVLSGTVSALPVGPGGGDETCLASGLGGASFEDATIPAVGSALWYLVRGDNACGTGSYGFEGSQGSPAAPRSSATCP